MIAAALGALSLLICLWPGSDEARSASLGLDAHTPDCDIRIRVDSLGLCRTPSGFQAIAYRSVD
jgi:hypothetical protein